MPGQSIPAARLAVLDRVRAGDTTVNVLAQSLSITDNAVRLHLVALERDGMLLRRGLRRSGVAGQPAAEYEISAAGEIALSSAYPPALTALVSAIGAKLDPRTRRALFVDAGRRLVAEAGAAATGSVAERAESCAALIAALGGKANVSASRNRATITGTGCPLAGAVRAEPGTCVIIEALLQGHSGLDVEQRCQHGEHLSCRFELVKGSAS